MSNLPCPRCSGVVLNRTPLGCLCKACEGCWFAFEQFEKALRLSDIELHASEIEPTLEADTEGVPLETPIACPQCQVRMKRHIYMLDSDVTIDMCRDHGMWLDDGELAKIRTYLQSTQSKEPDHVRAAPGGLFAFFRRIFGFHTP